MLKLYKRVDGLLRYHEAWANDGVLYEHWGVVGEQGESKEHELSGAVSEEKAIRDVLRPAADAGFRPIADEDQVGLAIEYPVEGHGTPLDLDKRHALEARMNETLGWTGVGHCDGGSIGSGSMEVFCIVVDFDIAERVVAADLRDTEFADYSRIYNASE